VKVVALSGWKGSGKDEVAKYLTTTGSWWIHCNFASHLKDLVAEQYNIPREWCDLRAFKERPLPEYQVDLSDDFARGIYNIIKGELAQVGSYKYWTPRALCILEGSVKRSVTSNYWTRRVIDNIKTYETNIADSNFVISDLRYKSEVAQLREAFEDKLLTVRINRFETSPSNDPSERDLDDHKFDLIIDNTGTLDQLKIQVEEKILGK
jgi:hypothetical protein